MASKKPPTVERSIFFYRADAGASNGKPKPVDLAPSLEKVSELDFKPHTTRYWEQTNGDAVAMWPDESVMPRWDRFTLATVRRGSLPRAEHQGKLQSLGLATGAGLHEPIHVIAFPENIFGIEFNFYGPRPSRLSRYLSYATQGTSPEFTLEPLLNRDMAKLLEEQQELRVLDLQVRASYAETLAEAETGLGQALRATAEASQAQVVGLVLRPEPRQRKGLAKSVLDFAKNVANRSDLNENATTFKVKGINELDRVIEINLLEDKLVSRKQIMRVGNNSRAIKQDSAFEAIEEAYAELGDALATAPGLSVVGADG